MKETQNDEPAFPFAYEERGPDPSTNKQIFSTPGMTLRDWFAGKALKGMVGKAAFDQSTEDMIVKSGVKACNIDKFISHLAYEFADAMMEERKKRS